VQWVAFEVLPLIAFACFLIAYLCKLVYKCTVLRRRSDTLHSHLPQVVSTSIVVLRILYLQISRNALDVFNWCVGARG